MNDMNAKGPLYQAVATDLMAQLKSGVWPPGTKLPTEGELSLTYKTSTTTIRSAIGLLKDSGLVDVRQGSGTYAVETTRFVLLQSSFQKLADRRGITKEGAWATEVRAQGHEPTTKFDCLSSLATGDLSEILQVKKGSRLIVRRSRRFVDNRPVAIELGSYPAWLTDALPLLAGPEIIPQGTTSWLAENGHKADHHFDTIEARISTSEESEFFEENKPITCLVRRRVTYSTEQKPLRAIDTIYRANLHTLAYEVPKG